MARIAICRIIITKIRHLIMTKPKTLIVTIPGMISETDLTPLRQQSDVDYREMQSTTEEELAEMCSGYDYLMLNMDVVPKRGLLKLTEAFYTHPSVQTLKGIAVDMTGMDYFSPQAAARAGVILQNIPHYSSQSVAESILSEILLHSRQRHLAYVDEIQKQPIQDRKGINLKNRTIGIVGYGSIGSTLAGILSGIGMNVVVWNRSPRPNLSIISLEQVFEDSDVICICLKTVQEGQEANVGIIDSNLLNRCSNSIIVNLANEVLVDQNAMINALSSGKVAAYSVETSSPNIREVFGIYHNVHFPPHNAWNSDESMQTLRDTWVANILSAIAGNPKNVYHE
jgi:phosphoglycerate dehydrogenase-like enzyme